MRTFVYVDGFNLYYGAVKDTRYKWLDLWALFSRILEPQHQILAIKYYTAKVKARSTDPDAPFRQSLYLTALRAHIPGIAITHGHFLESTVSMRLAHPIAGKKFAEVVKQKRKALTLILLYMY